MATGPSTRLSELRHMLQQRRRDIVYGVHELIREATEDASLSRANEVRDACDEREAMLQAEVRFALLSVKSEMVIRIDLALQRLSDGRYGSCDDCGEDIAESRLQIVPFAERCRQCQEQHEDLEDQRLRRSQARHWRLNELVNM